MTRRWCLGAILTVFRNFLSGFLSCCRHFYLDLFRYFPLLFIFFLLSFPIQFTFVILCFMFLFRVGYSGNSLSSQSASSSGGCKTRTPTRSRTAPTSATRRSVFCTLFVCLLSGILFGWQPKNRWQSSRIRGLVVCMIKLHDITVSTEDERDE